MLMNNFRKQTRAAPSNKTKVKSCQFASSPDLPDLEILQKKISFEE